MKLYYSDPIKAAYMHNTFRVKYEMMECPHEIDDGLINIVPCLHLSAEDSKEIKIFIHPESLRIFEPQLGDKNIDGYVFDSATQAWCKEVGEDENLGTLYTMKLPNELEIHKRNGKHFFMPEREK